MGWTCCGCRKQRPPKNFEQQYIDSTMMSATDSSLPRTMTPIGTTGEFGQLFTVYEKNWHCKDCGQENYASRARCFRCRRQKPEGEHNYVTDPALEALKSKGEIPWQEVIDPASYQIYYFNKSTGETQWERPVEMGEAPMATGWFGRGQAGSTAAQKYQELNKFYLSRAAVKQKEFIDPKKYHVEGSNEFNIWYGRFIGDMHDKKDKDPAPDRCYLSKHAGFTKADSGGEKRKDKRSFCLHFAHGVCAKGRECTFYHRIPTPEDDARCEEMVDCFGRQRHNAHRDDMNGVGSFMKPCRTLFVGNLLKQKYETPKAMHDALYKHFGEWGELENLNVIYRLSIAFPRYRLRTSAEFAKEAMSNQALDQGEILSIRWAHDDPNPVAQDSIARADKDAIAALLAAKGVSLAPAPFEYPVDYHLPETKKMRLENGIDISAYNPELLYPDTDAQYPSTSGDNGGSGSSTSVGSQAQGQAQVQDATVAAAAAAAVAAVGAGAGPGGQMTSEQYSEYCRLYSEYYYAISMGVQVADGPPSTGTSSTSATQDQGEHLKGEGADKPVEGDEDEEVEEEVWVAHVDPESGATFYFNPATNESTWTLPGGDAEADAEAENTDVGGATVGKEEV